MSPSPFSRGLCSLWGANPLQGPTSGPFHSSLGLPPALGEHLLLTPSSPHHNHRVQRCCLCSWFLQSTWPRWSLEWASIPIQGSALSPGSHCSQEQVAFR